MDIVVAPNAVLNSVCEECQIGDEGLIGIADQMQRLMYENNGCGIAAPQIGLNKRLVVIDVDHDGEHESTRNPIVLVNPTIAELRGEPVTEREACLSCPGINVPVTRQPWAKVSFYDLEGQEWEIEGDDLLGRCLQHEIDHLEGRTLFESCDDDVRIRAHQAYAQAKALGANPGDSSIDV